VRAGDKKAVAESFAMRFARGLGMEKAAWALRRLHCPVPKDALVLEVGSGGSPYARANVLLDAYEVTRERHWAPLIADRPTVLGFVENLPFRDGAFDFVIASHVLEHSPDPGRFIAELQRVARAGYIETPDAFMERINPYHDHRLEVTVRKNRLIIRKKSNWCVDPDLIELYEQRAKPWVAGGAIPRHPFDFHIRYYWSDRIDHEILNPYVDASWEAPKTLATYQFSGGRVRKRLLSGLRYLFSQNERNSRIDLVSLMRCPVCKGESLRSVAATLVCAGCGKEHPVRNGGIPDMISGLDQRPAD
jgi:SAM-dependent methyltransferase